MHMNSKIFFCIGMLLEKVAIGLGPMTPKELLDMMFNLENITYHFSIDHVCMYISPTFLSGSVVWERWKGLKCPNH